MTLGQKLKTLLKNNHMTQEDLAEKLEVSRQAVGKWVNDKGIPEVGKLIQISDLFGVSMDYLLKKDYGEKDCGESEAFQTMGLTPAEAGMEHKNVLDGKNVPDRKNVSDGKTVSDRGYYVSQEMLDGYLSYSRQNVKQITCGISLFMLSNVFNSFEQQNNMALAFLYWFTLIAGIAMIIWYFFQPKQYQEIKNERLTLDDQVLEMFKRQRESRRKKYTVMIIAGVIILFASSEIGYFFMTHFGRIVSNFFEWIADTLWLALILWAGMSMHIDSIILNNTEHTCPNSNRKRYRWVYMALPVTAAAVLVGFITNAWSPYAPIIILFCCLLVTTCKLLIESKEKR